MDITEVHWVAAVISFVLIAGCVLCVVLAAGCAIGASHEGKDLQSFLAPKMLNAGSNWFNFNDLASLNKANKKTRTMRIR